MNKQTYHIRAIYWTFRISFRCVLARMSHIFEFHFLHFYGDSCWKKNHSLKPLLTIHRRYTQEKTKSKKKNIDRAFISCEINNIMGREKKKKNHQNKYFIYREKKSKRKVERKYGSSYSRSSENSLESCSYAWFSSRKQHWQTFLILLIQLQKTKYKISSIKL